MTILCGLYFLTILSMKNLIEVLGVHVAAEMTRQPTKVSGPTQAVQGIPTPREDAMASFLAQREALRFARRHR